LVFSIACSSNGTGQSPDPNPGSSDDGGGTGGSDGGTDTGTSPVLAGCPILPSNHIFNTAIDKLPVHPNSAAFMTTIGTRNLHLDLSSLRLTTEFHGTLFTAARFPG
jgi:hypothetical protein